MKIVCAWCDKDMGEINGGGVDGVSHTICEKCSAKLIAEAENRTNAKGEPEIENPKQVITDV